MIVYHGTTSRRAQRICAEGFLPKKPSRRVWFAENRRYALGRAKTQAQRGRDKPVVLTCDLDLDEMRKRLGSKKVFRRSGVIAIDGRVPASVLRSLPPAERPRKPVGLTRSVIDILGLAPYRAVRRHHPGIDRLSRWVERRVASQPGRAIGPRELLARARHWLPEIFEGIRIDWEALRARRDLETMDFEVEPAAEPASAREDEALDCLLAEKPERRARGLAILAEIDDADLFDWCAMFLEDESVDVTVAALHTMLCCQDADPEVIAPFAEHGVQRGDGH